VRGARGGTLDAGEFFGNRGFLGLDLGAGVVQPGEQGLKLGADLRGLGLGQGDGGLAGFGDLQVEGIHIHILALAHGAANLVECSSGGFKIRTDFFEREHDLSFRFTIGVRGRSGRTG
jgi:hypothetical protein